MQKPAEKSSERSRHQVRRRRLLSYGVGFLILIPLGLLVNAGPYRDYLDAQHRYEAQAAEVALLQQENAAYQKEIERLGSDSYLEALARKELTYARPGEDVFIVKNLPEDEPAPAGTAPAPQAGPLQRLVDGVRALF